MSLSVSVVIPAYNEEQAIGPVVEELKGVLASKVGSLEILVVDDGSKDQTGARAKAAGATVLRHPTNGGYGKALQTGIAAAKNDWILMIDADGSYPPAEAAKLLPFAPDFDLVIGTRTGVYFWGSFTHALLRWFYLKLAGFVVGERVPDANSGLRLVRRVLAAEKGPVECLGFSHSTTMTLSFLKAGRFVKFLPIEFRARVGKSHVRLARDILRTLQIMAQVMVAFNPLKLFVVLAMFPGLFAAVCLAAYCGTHELRWLAALIPGVMAALACVFIGCILDAMRMHANLARKA